MDSDSEPLKKAARVTITGCLAVKPGEGVVVVTDLTTAVVGLALFEAALDAGAEALLCTMPTRKVSGEEPPDTVASIMKECDVLLLATKYSLSHTAARRAATEKGVRTASMPGITPEIMARTMSADYRAVAERTAKLVEKLAGAARLRLTAPGGTDIVVDVAGKAFQGDDGILVEPKAFGNLPAGEACAGINPRGTEGTAVFDGSFSDIGLLPEPIRVVFEEGVAKEIGGGQAAEKLKAKLEPLGPDAYRMAEVGIGTHDTARVSGVVLEDEKVLGTVHLALGNDLGLGGTNDVPLHLDGVILKPTLETDTGVTVLKDGDLLV